MSKFVALRGDAGRDHHLGALGRLDGGAWVPDARNEFVQPYAYGAIGAWLYNTIAGIEPDPEQPGYKHILLRPQPGGGLTSARGSLKTLYGEIISPWEITDGEFCWTIVVPPNTTATAYLPADHNQAITLDGSLVTGLVHDLQAGTHMFVVE